MDLEALLESPRMRRCLVLLLLLPAFVPCGLAGDPCDEAAAQGCSSPCHLGCGVLAPAELTFVAAAIGPADGTPRTDLASEPISRPHLPELPPPRS